MRLILAGLCLAMLGIGVQLAMVVRVIEPGLLLSLLGFCAAFGGCMAAIGGIIRKAGRRH